MKKRILFAFALFLFAIGLAGCQPKPEYVVTQLADAVNAGDIEAGLALFTEDSVVTATAPEPFVGKEEIQVWLEMMAVDNFQLESEIIEVKGDTVIEKDVIRMDSLIPLGIEKLEGTTEVTVQDGKIKTLTFVLTEESLTEYMAAMEATAQAKTDESQPAEVEETAEKPEPTPTPGPKPSPRGTPNKLAYDAESNRVILFGGFKPQTGKAYSDTWAFDPDMNAWMRLKPDTTPGKGDGSLAYDAGSDRVIFFAGAFTESGEHADFKAGSETWAYDFNTNTWTNLEPAEAPFDLKGASMVYDSESDRVILFGGWAANLAGTGSNDTWVYDFDTNTWTLMQPEASPPSRYYHAMAYDSESDRVILWGGNGPQPIDVSSVWAYDYNTDTWEELESERAPEPEGYAAMVYDAEADLAILYAGKEVWTFDYNSNTWTLVSDSPEPGEIFHQGMVYTNEGQTILFGGGPTMFVQFNKTWMYDSASDAWTNLTP